MKTPYPPSKQPIPENAQKVFQGEIFSVYQWPQKMYDGSLVTFEKISRQATVSVLPITEDNKILLGKQSQPTLKEFTSTLGGRVEDGEDPLHAAKRELLEESGYEAGNWELLHSQQFFEKIEWPCYIFIAKNLKKVAQSRLDPGEKIELVEYSFDDFIKLTAQKDFRDTEISLLIYRLLQNESEMQKLNNRLSN